MSNLSNIFSTNVRITNMDPMDPLAIWPMNIEICICRIPIRKKDGFTQDKIKQFSEKLKNHMVHNGIVFLICYAPVEDRSRPFEVAKSMSDAGFYHIDNIVYEKTWFPGKRSDVNLVNSHEYVLHFCNGKVWRLDRTPIREYMGTDDDTSCPGNTWKIKTGSLDESYPIDLAELLIRMTDCLPGSVVFDPFCGTTASLNASMKLGHSFFAFEKDTRKLNKYKKIIDQHKQDRELDVLSTD